MTNNTFTRTLGDHFIYKIRVDFIKRETDLIFGEHPDFNSNEKYQLIFNEIVWQDYNGFDFQNIFNAMEIDDSYMHFMKVKHEYIQSMKRYFPADLLNTIKGDKTLKYYYFLPTAGLGGFVICRHADIVKLDEKAIIY
jgi:hypothetical protein